MTDAGWVWDASHFPHRVSAAFADVYTRAAEAGLQRGLRRYGVGLFGWQVRVDEGLVRVRSLNAVPPNEIVARERAAAETITSRRWCADADRWRDSGRLRRLSRITELAERVRGQFDLASHIEDVARVAREGVEQHFELHLADMLPLGRLLIVAGDREAVLRRTAGLSPWSGRSAPLIGASTAGHLDVDAPTVDELGMLPSGAIAAPSAVEPFGDPALDALLADVRATFWVRDDNASLLMAAPIGLLRTALLEASRRLDLPMLNATAGEAAALLRGQPGPAVDELEARERARANPIPPQPTPEVEPPVLPIGTASSALAEALLAYDALYEPEAQPYGIGTQVVRGRAVVAPTPDAAAERLEPGAVLIVRTTAPAFDPLLLLCSAVVCEEGGPLCHAAIAARELGLTAVVGLRGATAAFTDGMTVIVDPNTASVTAVSP